MLIIFVGSRQLSYFQETPRVNDITGSQEENVSEATPRILGAGVAEGDC
jgi:hypothetical protein